MRVSGVSRAYAKPSVIRTGLTQTDSVTALTAPAPTDRAGNPINPLPAGSGPSHGSAAVVVDQTVTGTAGAAGGAAKPVDGGKGGDGGLGSLTGAGGPGGNGAFAGAGGGGGGAAPVTANQGAGGNGNNGEVRIIFSN